VYSQPVESARDVPAPGPPAASAPRFHTNAMEAQGGPFDLTLNFGFRAVPDEEPEVQTRVSMSWEHAKAMVKAIQGLVDDYEEKVGEIPDLERLREEAK
jgi:hypothetical protein